jgi:hypothetical protein
MSYGTLPELPASKAFQAPQPQERQEVRGPIKSAIQRIRSYLEVKPLAKAAADLIMERASYESINEGPEEPRLKCWKGDAVLYINIAYQAGSPELISIAVAKKPATEQTALGSKVKTYS